MLNFGPPFALGLCVTSFKFIRKWLRRERYPRRLALGNCVRIVRSARSPLPGELGNIIDVCLDDPVRPFLVQFANGLQFRYGAWELEVATDLPALDFNPYFRRARGS